MSSKDNDQLHQNHNKSRCAKEKSIGRREAIEAAFRRLPLLTGKEDSLRMAVNMLANVDCSGPGTPPPKFSAVGRNQTSKELQKLARLADALAECIDALHEPAILALADAGLEVRLKLPSSLRDIAKRARQTDLDQLPAAPHGGKPTNNRAHAIADMLAYHYHALTGEEPSRHFDPYSDNDTSRSPFVTLVDEMFRAMGLHVNAEHVARAAIGRRPGARRKPGKS